MADITAVCSGAFRVVAVYAINDQEERLDFFRRFGSFLVDASRLVLMEEWNVVLVDHLRGEMWT